MTDKRLLYRVILKVMGTIGIIALLSVFLSSAFYSNIETTDAVIDVNDTRVDVSRLFAGDVIIVRWNNRRVGVLKRTDATQLALVKQMSNAPKPSLDAVNLHAWRSFDPRFFVYYDVGDSGHCPLFVDNEGGEAAFKDTCSGNWFDAQGRFKSDNTAGLKIPPYYYSDMDELVIGRWFAK